MSTAFVVTDPVPMAVAILAAGVLAWFGPRVIAALPEPEEPAADKPSYVSMSEVRGLAPSCALAALVAMAVLSLALPTALLPAWVAFVVGGVWLAYIDVRTRLLPFALTALLHVLCLLLVALAALIERDLTVLVRAVVANVVVFVIFWLIWAIGRRFGGGAFGYGDVRLAAIVGLVLGAIGGREVVIGAYASFLIGAVVGVLLIATRVVRSRTFAFGPYLVLGALVGVVLPALT